MPYIDQDSRKKWRPVTDRIISICATSGITPGELNYLMTKLAQSYVQVKGKNYTHLNDVKGVFACASDEFTRRTINDYEDTKIKENGDV